MILSLWHQNLENIKELRETLNDQSGNLLNIHIYIHCEKFYAMVTGAQATSLIARQLVIDPAFEQTSKKGIGLQSDTPQKTILGCP